MLKRHTQPIPAKRSVDIFIPREGDYCVVDNSRPVLGMSDGSRRDYNKRFLDVMGDIRQEIHRKIRSGADDDEAIRMAPDFSHNVLEKLKYLGVAAYASLGDEFDETLDKLEDKDEGRGLSVTIKSSFFPLLWEMLYTGKPGDETKRNRFWGFRHRVARFQQGMNAGEQEIYSDKDFLFGHHNGLEWQNEHKTIFRLAEPRFRQIHMLGDILFNLCCEEKIQPDSGHMIRALLKNKYAAIHFACHCCPDLKRNSVLESTLEVSWDSTKPNLAFQLFRLIGAKRDKEFLPESFVFLNACKTMSNPDHLMQSESFPNGFLGFGASSVIATACDIPDRFAAAFACEFYRNLIQDTDGKSPTVSDALLAARRKFMKPPYNNPLGLAYGLYARNELHFLWDNPPEEHGEKDLWR